MVSTAAYDSDTLLRMCPYLHHSHYRCYVKYMGIPRYMYSRPVGRVVLTSILKMDVHTTGRGSWYFMLVSCNALDVYVYYLVCR